MALSPSASSPAVPIVTLESDQAEVNSVEATESTDNTDFQFYSSGANTLRLSANLTETQKLFHTALENVRKNHKSQASSSSAVTKPHNETATRKPNRDQWSDSTLVQVCSAATIDELQTMLEQRRSETVLWKSKKSKLNVRYKIKSILDVIQRFKEPLSLVFQINTMVGKPLWGAICFLTSIGQDLFETPSLVKNIEKYLGHCLDRFQAYDSNIVGSVSLLEPCIKDSVVNFYEIVVEFCYSALTLYSRSAWRSTRAVLLKGVKHGYEVYLQELKDAAERVDRSTTTSTYVGVRDMKQNQFTTAATTTSNPRTPAVTTSPTTYLVPNLISKHFTGRDETLALISSLFARGINANEPQPDIIALHGAPGMGKTSTAIRYASSHRYRVSATEGYKHVFFVCAESFETLLSDFNAIANTLELCLGVVQQPQHKTLLAQLNKWFRANAGSWLLIFDNVQAPSDLHRFLPPLGAAGHVLCTTKSQQIAESLAGASHSIELRAFSNETGANLILSIYGYTDQTSDDQYRQSAEQISGLCAGLPIAIEQAVRNARKQHFTLGQLYRQLQSTVNILIQEHPTSFHEKGASVAALLLQSFHTIVEKNRAALELFQLMVFFRQAAIPIEVFTEGGKWLGRHIDRPVTYDRGVVHSPMDDEIVGMMNADIENECPAKTKTWYSRTSMLQRVLKTRGSGNGRDGRVNGVLSAVSGNATVAPEGPHPVFPDGFPRVDSRSDIELTNFCVEKPQGKLLVDLLADEHLIKAAICVLVDVGLVQKIDHNTIRVHDLFAEMTRTLVKLGIIEPMIERFSNKSDSQYILSRGKNGAPVKNPTTTRPSIPSFLPAAKLRNNPQVYIHLAATLVYLIFPVTGPTLRFESPHVRAVRIIPTALTIITWLQDAQVSAAAPDGHNQPTNPTASLLADSTIGPELAHVTATALSRGGSRANDLWLDPNLRTELQTRDNHTIHWLFDLAMTGYRAASARLLQHPAVNGNEAIIQHTARFEHDYEYTRGFLRTRALDLSERWGPPMVRLAMTLEALAYHVAYAKWPLYPVGQKPKLGENEHYDAARQEAVRMHRAVLEIMRRVYGQEGHPQVRSALDGLVAVLEHACDFQGMLEVAMERVRWHDNYSPIPVAGVCCDVGRDRETEIETVESVGRALKGIGGRDREIEALDWFGKALVIAESGLGSGDRVVAGLVFEVATLERKVGRGSEEGMKVMGRIVDVAVRELERVKRGNGEGEGEGGWRTGVAERQVDYVRELMGRVERMFGEGLEEEEQGEEGEELELV